MRLSRRQMMAGGVAGIAMGASRGSADAATVTTLRTAVIGAGMSGLYSTWRLLGQGHAPGGIAIFEGSDRIGGRLMTVNMKGAEAIGAEFGGMRFLTSQTIVSSLIDHLKLEARGFPMGGADNLNYIRGKRWKNAEYATKGAVPYDLPAGEAGLDPTALMVKAIDKLIPGAEKLTPSQWMSVQKSTMLDGRKLSAWGFRDLLNHYLSFEAQALVEIGGGYHSIPRNWNAAEALPWLLADFANNPAYKTLVKGMATLPHTLAAAVESKGTTINKGHRLISLRVPAQTGTGLHELVFATPAGRRTVRAERVILGLPRRAIEDIADSAALKTPAVTALLSTVTPRALAKAYLVHPEPYWRQFGLTSGKLTTDLPARQFYYFGTEPERQTPPSGVLTMAYFDGESVDFWDGYRRLEAPDASGFSMLDPNGPFAQEMTRQIVITHGLSKAPSVISAGYVNWGDMPYGAGWHSWNQNANSWEIMDRVMTPIPGTKLHIVGEAWSTGQGWIEGALQTAEAMLEKHMNLPRPGWLPA